MKPFEEKAIELVKSLVIDFSELEFCATIGNTSRSIEFFVSVNNEMKQCYELVDMGIIDEVLMEKLFEQYADFVRKHSTYSSDTINKIEFKAKMII